MALSGRLGRTTLARLPAASRPLLDPDGLRPGIIHFGLGAFHRAHQAVYTEAAIAATGGHWGIVGVAPHSRTVLDALAEQDHLFSVVPLGDEQTAATQVVAALTGGVHAASEPGEVTRLLADPAIRIVTLTVTEKAYRTDGAVPRLIMAGLSARARADAGPITLLSCDNLPANGRTLDTLLRRMLPSEVADWYDESVTCPRSVVDRIVPATTAATLAQAAADLGVRDLATVGAEPFQQWVIEDNFAAGRPDWAAAGALLTKDVTAWEHLKLRALNGTHSACAYLGALAGCETIADTLRLPGLIELLRHYLATEVAASLIPPEQTTVTEYGDTVLARFGNAAVGHQTLQVAMDGSQKLPQRVLSVLNARGVQPRLATLILAAWFQFTRGSADDRSPLPLQDPNAAQIRVAGVAELFGPDGLLPVFDDAHRHQIGQWVGKLARHGAADVVRDAVREAC